MIGEVARHELRLQLREFLTWVYLAVFFFLTFGHASAGAVELVSARGDIPRAAPWAVAHAMAGVTAFGQVITTMVTATAVMRDVATRQQELLFTTRLSPRDYLAGRWLGALAIMGLTYAGIPLGLLSGFMVSGVPWEVGALVRPLALLVVPNVLVVSALFFAAGALRRSFMTILLLGVGLVALWSTGVALARDGVVAGAWLDPFGNAALEWTTRAWTASDRATRQIPPDGVLLGNRALWLTLAALALAVLRARFRMAIDPPPSTPPAARPLAGTPRWPVPTAPPRAQAVLRHQGWWTALWTLREKGFVTLAALGALNALANAAGAGGDGATFGDIMGTVHTHARVFLILVATIQAGEVAWRARDVRASELHDVLPVRDLPFTGAQVLGVLLAQLVLVAPLLVVGVGVAWWREVPWSPLAAVGWAYGITWTFLAQVTAVSLAVHALVQHKVAGHVTLIAGWVLAVAMDRAAAWPPYLRYAALPDAWTPGQATRLVAWWSAVAAVAFLVAMALWVRGDASHRWEATGRRLRGPLGGALLGTVALACWLGLRAA